MIKEEQIIYEALQRQNDSLSQRMKLSEGFKERLMQRIDKHKTKDRQILIWLYSLIGAAAASVVLFMLFTPHSNRNNALTEIVNEQSDKTEIKREDELVTSQVKEQEESQQTLLAYGHLYGNYHKAKIKQVTKEETKEQAAHDSTIIVQTSTSESRPSDDSSADSTCITSPISTSTNPNLHYASYNISNDSSYISPALMDEFIKKLATNYGVESDNSCCTADSAHADMVCTMYVFPDTKDIDLFGRLLIAAITYDDTMPGYLLNYSRQQFFFTLNDKQHERKYVWIAERIGNDRIMLYCSNSPIGDAMSSECFQKYRNKITNIINPKTTEL